MIQYFSDETNCIEIILSDNSTISYPRHNHVSVYTIGAVLNGNLILNVNNKSFDYKSGNTFMLSPYMVHSIKAVTPYTMLSICIKKSSINHLDFNGLRKYLIRLPAHNFGLTDNIQEQILLHLADISLVKSVSNHEVQKSSSYSANTNLSMTTLKEHLENFPELKISVEEMASKAFISKYHFIRNFKTEVGLTPHQFQLQNRIRKAQHLLQHTSDTITEVAMTTGFCDQSHFIKQFEKIVGLTPTDYKLACSTLKLS